MTDDDADIIRDYALGVVRRSGCNCNPDVQLDNEDTPARCTTVHVYHETSCTITLRAKAATN